MLGLQSESSSVVGDEEFAHARPFSEFGAFLSWASLWIVEVEAYRTRMQLKIPNHVDRQNLEILVRAYTLEPKP